MGKLRQSLEQQIYFLEKLEKSLMNVLYDVIKQRFKKEIAANNVLYTIIQRGMRIFLQCITEYIFINVRFNVAIENATELEELWQVCARGVLHWYVQ